jgi:hypothetical protein
MSEGFIASLTSIVRDVRSPDGLARYLGIILFVIGVLRGPFTIDNQMIGWGLVCLSASFAWWYLWRITFIRRDWQGLNVGRKIVWSYLVCGLAFLTVVTVLFYHQITDIWLIPSMLKQYFPMPSSTPRV